MCLDIAHLDVLITVLVYETSELFYVFGFCFRTLAVILFSDLKIIIFYVFGCCQSWPANHRVGQWDFGTFYVFEFCFRTLAVILVSNFVWIFYVFGCCLSWHANHRVGQWNLWTTWRWGSAPQSRPTVVPADRDKTSSLFKEVPEGKTKKTRHTDSSACYNNRLCWRITLFCCQTGAALRFLFLSDFPPSRSDRHLAYTTSFDLREDRWDR